MVVTVVRCECVHGRCKVGDNRCWTCDAGWHGKLCDIPNKIGRSEATKISEQKKEVQREIIKTQEFETKWS